MEFRDLLEKRKSIRKFTPSEISDAALLRICEAGRLAPSGCNLQNREFIIIRDMDLREQLQEMIQPDFVNAAAVIALVMDPGETRFGSYWVQDASAAMENMLLAIVDEGFDSVWIEGTLRPHESKVKALLDIPSEKRLFAFLPIGKAAKDRPGPPKTPLKEILHWEKFESKKLD